METAKKIFYTLTTAAIFLSAQLYADIKLPRIFSNSMVLQCGEPVNVWGKSEPNAKVEVAFANQRVSTKAGADGSWSVKLAAMKPSAQGATLTVYENGAPKRTISDVLVGEVWIAGGQSNMAFGLKGADGSKELIENANNSLVRYFNMGGTPRMKSLDGIGKNPEWDCVKGASWLVCSPKNAEYCFKAVPYIFARDLAKKLNIPVGIVYTAIPGTNMRSWIPRADFEENPKFAKQKELFQNKIKNYDAKKALEKYEESVRTYPERVAKAKKEGYRPPEAWTVSEEMRPWKDSPDRWASPCMLYNIRIAPIKNFTARGIVWYQGEADSYIDYFDSLFTAFIEVWRREFGKPNMPFVFVQLPSFESKNWCKIRLQQQSVADKIPNVFMATTVDTGTKDDIHPHDKLPVGERLAALTLAKVYNAGGVRACGPKMKSVRYENNGALVAFDSCGKLEMRGEPRGFEVLADGKWRTANAKLHGNSVSVFAPDKKAKVSGVRYLHKNWAKPDVCLYDDGGLPAYPFEDLKK